jgi:hypothetical protein
MKDPLRRRIKAGFFVLTLFSAVWITGCTSPTQRETGGARPERFVAPRVHDRDSLPGPKATERPER